GRIVRRQTSRSSGRLVWVVDRDPEPQRARRAALPADHVDATHTGTGAAMIPKLVGALALRARQRTGPPLDPGRRCELDRPLARATRRQLGELLSIAHALAGVALLGAARGALGPLAADGHRDRA